LREKNHISILTGFIYFERQKSFSQLVYNGKKYFQLNQWISEKKLWEISIKLLVFKYQSTCRSNIYIEILTINSKKIIRVFEI